MEVKVQEGTAVEGVVAEKAEVQGTDGGGTNRLHQTRVSKVLSPGS